MKKIFILAFLSILTFGGFSQTVQDYAVELTVKTSKNPSNITLQWKSDANAIKYYIYKKSKSEWTWKFLDSSLSKTDSFYTDNSINIGQAYEYWVSKKLPKLIANGYIYAGIDIPTLEKRGTVILLVDSNYVSPLKNEIAQYENDLKNDGWEIKKHSILRTENVTNVKAKIYKEWLADSMNIKNVILFGNIPVPYSGDIAPDGHPDHEGAWPADVYYTTFDLAWTDNFINISVASRNENKNVKGDDKFDQSYIWPALSKIPIGRIDFTKMPAFGLNDTLLMKRYLDKNHQYRIGNLKAEKRGLIDDNFGVFGGEAFASCAYRNYNTLFFDTITKTDYRSILKNSSYLLSYGCGAGSYTSCGGIGSTTDFVNDSLLNPFTMLFGSYFLDWDVENNYLRAPLASKGWGLASIAGGRPYAMLHHTALGESIGFAATCGQNASPTYQTGLYDFGTFVHIALMGDPTLRLFNAPILESLKAETNCKNSDVLLSWKKNTDADSFRIYIWNDKTLNYEYKISIPSSDSVYNDDISGAGKHSYMLRTIKNEITPSGNFYNLGMMAKIETISYKPIHAKIYFDDQIHYCKNDSFLFIDSTVHPIKQRRSWSFDKQNYTDSLLKIPFSENGNYTVYLSTKTTQNCESMDSIELNITHFLDADFAISDSVICLYEDFKITPKNTSNADSILVKTFPFLNEINNSNFEYKANISDTIFVILIYQDAYQCKDSTSIFVFVNTLPFDSSSMINYSWKTDSCFNSHELVLEYQNASSDENYLWDLGDGDSAKNASNIKKKYAAAGNYLVKLNAQNKITNCKSTIEKSIYVYENPILSNINSSWVSDSCLSTNQLQLSCNLDTKTQTFIWYFGDGDSAINVKNIPKKYKNFGDFTVKLIAKIDSSGCSSEVQKSITVYQNPVQPKIYISNTNIIENKTELIRTDYDQNYKYFWNSNGNLSNSDSLHKKNFMANKIGNYFVSLKVENDMGCQSDSVFKNLNVLVNGIYKTKNGLFSVYPNPTKNLVNLSNHNLLNGIYNLIDINGKTCQNGKINAIKNQQILMENLAEGIYFLNIYSEEFYNVYKNPISLDHIGIDARGVILANGDLYLSESFYPLHDEIVEFLIKNKIIDKKFNYN